MSDSARTKNDVIRQVVVLALVIAATIAANVLSMSAGEADQGTIANETFGDTVFFFPATYVFGTIWPLIYLGIVGLAIHQALPSQATNPRYRKGTVILAVNLVLNASWVVIFNLELFLLSLITIVPILVTAVIAHTRLGVARSPEAGTAEKVLTIPVGIYTAWLTIATVANVSLALVNAGWNGFGVSYETWGMIMLIVGLSLGVLLLLAFRDPAFPATYAYAYAGIMVRRLGEVQRVAVTALVCGALFLILFALTVIQRRRNRLSAT